MEITPDKKMGSRRSKGRLEKDIEADFRPDERYNVEDLEEEDEGSDQEESEELEIKDLETNGSIKLLIFFGLVLGLLGSSLVGVSFLFFNESSKGVAVSLLVMGGMMFLAAAFVFFKAILDCCGPIDFWDKDKDEDDDD